MDSQQTLVYECSRKNAQIQVGNSQWTNIFNEPIELQKGDTVRMLGSFISEAGEGNDISLDEDFEFTLNWSPYINADTVKFDSTSGAAHTPNASYQMKLGDIAQPCYFTDNFGIEPPYHPTGIADLTSQTALENASLRDLNTQYKDYSDSTAHYDYNNDIAIKMGCDIDTHSSGSELTASDYDKIPGTLFSFGGQNLEQEFLVGHMCKLIRFPVFKGIHYLEPNGSNTAVTPVTKYFDPNEDILKVGDTIATYFNGPIWDIDGASSSPRYYPYPGTNDPFGEPQYDKGPRSVTGNIIAMKDVYEDIYDPLDNISRSCLFRYVYVQDFSNPGQYKFKNSNSTYPRHGAPQKENGYNDFRNDNKLNGFSYNYYMTLFDPNSGSDANAWYGQNYMYQLVSERLLNQTGQNPGPPKQSDLPFPNNTSKEIELKNQFNHNLSFFWSGMPSNTMPFNTNEGGEGGSNDPSNANGTMLNQFTSWVRWIDNFSATGVNVIIQEDVPMGATTVKLDLTALPYLREPGANLTVFGFSNPNYSQEIIEINEEEGYVEVGMSEASLTNINGGTALQLYPNEGGWFWYPHSWRIHCYQDTNNSTPAQFITNQNNINEWIGCGGIYKVNQENDNLTPHTPAAGKINRCYIAYNHQKVESPYKARNFGTGSDNKVNTLSNQYSIPNHVNPHPNATPQSRTRQIFGQSCGFPLPGGVNSGNPDNKPMPWCWTGFPGMNPSAHPGNHVIKNPVCGTVYNEYCCSIHFQGDDGLTVPAAGNQTQFENNVLFKGDLIYTKRYKTAFKVPKGFYSLQKFTDLVNDQLHYSTAQYNEEIGDENTSVSGFDHAYQSSNSVLGGNFIHTYLPDLTYGFFPLTPDVKTELGLEGFNTIEVNDFFKYPSEYFKYNTNYT